MPPTLRNRLGDLERAVLECLWASAETHPDGLTVRQVHDTVGVERGIAYTTVMTVLDRMAKKDLVRREREGRAWRYRPAASREALTSEALHQTLGELSGGNRRSALLHFLEESTPEDLDALKAALAQLEAAHPTEASRPPGRTPRT
ncbi:MAG: BlaI/MecI/CopY family transcriptional regulator [Micrococcales bacterium]|nr:BlaI/MecI/CopY family transcriptional regulator [Micrococcales bacterium]